MKVRAPNHVVFLNARIRQMIISLPGVNDTPLSEKAFDWLVTGRFKEVDGWRVIVNDVKYTRVLKGLENSSYEDISIDVDAWRANYVKNSSYDGRSIDD